MSLSSTRASTQDSTGGTQVASVAVTDGSAGTIQANALVGCKTDFTELSRTGLTAADAPTGGDMTASGFGASLGTCGNALSLACRATCDTASATLQGRVAFYDGGGNCLCLSELVTFTSDATRRLGNATGDFVCPRTIVDAGQAVQFKFFVESVTAGTWAVKVRPV